MDIQLRSAALVALRRALMPLVRVALRVGVTYSDFSDVAKEAYFDAARDDYGVRGRPTNLARVAVLTGLSRRECSRLKKSRESGERRDERPTLSPAAHLMAIWSTDPRYAADGVAEAVARTGPAPSLSALIGEHAGDLPEGAVIAELNRVGALTPTTLADGTPGVRLSQRSFVPAGLNEDKLRIAANQFADLGATVVFNLDAVKRTKLQRYVVNDDLPESLVPAFQKLATELGQSLLERLDAWLSEHAAVTQNTPAVEPRKTVRTGLGLYFFDQNTPGD